MTKTGYDISNTGIISEYGQFNSNANDIKIGISQSIKFPNRLQKATTTLNRRSQKGAVERSFAKKGIDQTGVSRVLRNVVFKRKGKAVAEKR